MLLWLHEFSSVACLCTQGKGPGFGFWLVGGLGGSACCVNLNSETKKPSSKFHIKIKSIKYWKDNLWFEPSVLLHLKQPQWLFGSVCDSTFMRYRCFYTTPGGWLAVKKWNICDCEYEKTRLIQLLVTFEKKRFYHNWSIMKNNRKKKSLSKIWYDCQCHL